MTVYISILDDPSGDRHVVTSICRSASERIYSFSRAREAAQGILDEMVKADLILTGIPVLDDNGMEFVFLEQPFETFEEQETLEYF